MHKETRKRLKVYFQNISKKSAISFAILEQEIRSYEKEEFIMTIPFGGGNNGR